MKFLFILSTSFFLFSLQLFSQSIVVNPDGTHSVGIQHGSTTICINPDGSHSVGIQQGPGAVVLNPHGSQPSGFNHHSLSGSSGSAYTQSSLKKILHYINEDLLFSEASSTYYEELFKLKILKLNKVINKKEYRILKKRSLKRSDKTGFMQANQLFELHSLLNSQMIDDEAYSSKKMKLIQEP